MLAFHPIFDWHQKPTWPVSPSALHNFVRYRFRKDRKLSSPSQIANSLKTGASILDLLQECNAQSAPALAELTDLLNSTTSLATSTAARRTALAQARSPTSPKKLAKIAHLRAEANKANHRRYPGSKPILERPLPLSEIKSEFRKVPSLVKTQGIPFLRYSKPQPISLSRMIRQTTKTEEKKWTQKEQLEDLRVLTDYEDQWDNLVIDQHGVGHTQQGEAGDGVSSTDSISGRTSRFAHRGSNQMEPSWGDDTTASVIMLMEELRERDAKHAEMGRKMWEIVKKERELKRQEKIQRRIDRKKAAVLAAAKQGETDTEREENVKREGHTQSSDT